uniref:Uncharacterized protein n=1 Tax=Oryza rufipogon TaxID=4529 RepID=A0A0E0QDS6_ORYRU
MVPFVMSGNRSCQIYTNNFLDRSADKAFTSTKVAVATGTLIEPLLWARRHINWINSRSIIRRMLTVRPREDQRSDRSSFGQTDPSRSDRPPNSKAGNRIL